MSPKIKAWSVLAVIFVAGILTGVALTMALASHFMHAPGEAQMKRHLVAHYIKVLKLTPDQQARIEPILNDTAAKVQALHHEEIDRISQIFKSSDEQIAAFLTPEQKPLLQKLQTEREKMFPGRMRPWSHGGPGDKPDRGGPGAGSDGDGGMPPPPPSGAPPSPPSPGQ